MTLEEIEQITNAATPGNWCIEFSGSERHQIAILRTNKSIDTGCKYEISIDHREDYSNPEPDAKFIAMARKEMPKLIAIAKAAKKGMTLEEIEKFCMARDAAYEEAGDDVSPAKSFSVSLTKDIMKLIERIRLLEAVAKAADEL